MAHNEHWITMSRPSLYASKAEVVLRNLLVSFCEQEDKLNQLIAKPMKTTSQIKDQIDQIETGDRLANKRTPVHDFNKTVEETKAVCRHQKSLSNKSGAFQGQKIFEGDEVRWMLTTQK